MPVSIIHLPYNQGNFISSLQYAERKRGAFSISVARENPFVDPPDIVLSNGYWRKISTVKTFLTARRSDIISLNFGSSLYDTPSRHAFLLDLPLYRGSQKKMMYFQGSDARISYGKEILESREYEKSLGYSLEESTVDGFIPKDEVCLKLRKAKKIDRYVDRLFYFNPDLSVGLPERAQFMHYPYLASHRPLPEFIDSNRPLRVLHLSSNRVLKGTGLIERALNIASKNIHLDFRTLVRVPKCEASRAMDWADVLIDQVGLGWYGMQAVEALSRGKIVICTIDQTAWAKHLSDYKETPSGIINSTHQNIPKTLAELSDNKKMRYELSVAAVKFVDEIHDPVKILDNSYGDWIDGHG